MQAKHARILALDWWGWVKGSCSHWSSLPSSIGPRENNVLSNLEAGLLCNQFRQRNGHNRQRPVMHSLCAVADFISFLLQQGQEVVTDIHCCFWLIFSFCCSDPQLRLSSNPLLLEVPKGCNFLCFDAHPHLHLAVEISLEMQRLQAPHHSSSKYLYRRRRLHRQPRPCRHTSTFRGTSRFFVWTIWCCCYCCYCYCFSCCYCCYCCYYCYYCYCYCHCCCYCYS